MQENLNVCLKHTLPDLSEQEIYLEKILISYFSHTYHLPVICSYIILLFMQE